MSSDANVLSPSEREQRTAVRLQIVRLLARQELPEEKLELLRRLRKRYVEGRLPRETESRIEQSFNEQLFAKIFGYRTLFSHDILPYHLRPKNFAVGTRRYDDFSLGRFWGDDRDVVIATAEFKDPGTDLDAPQTDRPDKISPVAQAFRAAQGFPSCAWVIVSNFRDLRLYRIDRPHVPIGAFDLHDVRSHRQLARLCTYFERDALLGSEKEAGMSIATNLSHPTVPISASESAFRVVGTFTPRAANLELPLWSIYDATRAAANAHLKAQRGAPDDIYRIPLRIEDGWCSIDMEATRLATSTEGQIRLSVKHPRTCHPAQVNPDAGLFTVARDIRTLQRIVTTFFQVVQKSLITGYLSVELLEIKNWRFHFDGNSDLLKADDDTNAGVADKDEILSGDVIWPLGPDDALVAAACLGEMALQFQDANGFRIRFNHDALAQRLI